MITVGDDVVGHVLDCPLPESGPWQVVGIADPELAQAAYQLQAGSLPQLGQPSAVTIDLPITRIGNIAGRGPYHMDIYWDKADKTPQGPFEKHQPPINSEPTYPMLWSHQAKCERRLIVNYDSEGVLKSYSSMQEELNQKAKDVWATATGAHYNRDLQFNSQSLIVAMTERKCIGGRAWPSVVFADPDHEYAFALWCNSTLGLLLHWWVSNKTQSGRGTTTVTSIPNIPTLDTRTLIPEQHATARRIFDDLRQRRFLPFDQIDEDAARHELDRRLLVEVLGLPAALCEPGGTIDLLRRKLAAEPQIHGGKKRRVVFTEDGERTEMRDDR